MGFPENESRAALAAAMGNPDLAYEFLLTGIPTGAGALPTPPRAGSAPAAPAAVSINDLRRHPQFNMLKQLVQQNPGALSQVLDLIGQQSPELLAVIHQNNDAFIAMMNEPIVDTPAPAPTPAPAAAAAAAAAGGNPLANPAAMMQMLSALPAPQRAQFAQQLGMTPDQLDGFMQMMASMPPGQMENIMNQAGAAHGHGEHGADPPGVIRLTEEEMAAVNRLMALGFSQQQAAQAYLACDKNETLAANLLFEGGWGDDEGGMGGGYGGGGDEDDNMYN
jgi:UV excision repair protein RAD23